MNPALNCDMRTQTLLSIGGGLVLGLAILACSGGGGSIQSTSSSGGTSSSSGSTSEPPTPKEEVTVSPPSTALEVTATIIAATLGDECGGNSGGFAAGDCADTESKGGCGICRESNVQLSFKTGAGTAAKIEITSVTLYDAKGTQLDTLDASTPQSWNGTAYVAWDQSLAPSSNVKASYQLSAPSWSTIDKAGTSSYSQKFRIRVALKIDGVPVILESTELSREAMVAT